MQMGVVASGGGGCACPESTLLKVLLNHLIVEEQDAIIVDMEAGLEHLGRGTAQCVDGLVIVMEQGQRSITTAKSIVKLAKDLGVENFYGIANKIINTSVEEIQEQVGDELKVVAAISYTPDAIMCDFTGKSLFDTSPLIVSEVEKALERIRADIANG